MPIKVIFEFRQKAFKYIKVSPSFRSSLNFFRDPDMYKKAFDARARENGKNDKP